MLLLYDVHTHSHIKQEGVVRIKQLTLSETPYADVPFSVSIHPWDVLEPYNLELLKQYASLPNCLAIGETGLDKLKPHWKIQVDVFLEHIRLAKEVQKPLIIHCVKAFDDCLQLLKQENFKHGVLFHGFNKHPQLAKQLIKKGHYISLGAFFLKENPNFERFLIDFNFNGVLFETDDHTQLNVKSLYEKAAYIHPELDIPKTINQNFNNWKEK